MLVCFHVPQLHKGVLHVQSLGAVRAAGVVRWGVACQAGFATPSHPPPPHHHHPTPMGTFFFSRVCAATLYAHSALGLEAAGVV